LAQRAERRGFAAGSLGPAPIRKGQEAKLLPYELRTRLRQGRRFHHRVHACDGAPKPDHDRPLLRVRRFGAEVGIRASGYHEGDRLAQTIGSKTRRRTASTLACAASSSPRGMASEGGAGRNRTSPAPSHISDDATSDPADLSLAAWETCRQTAPGAVSPPSSRLRQRSCI